MSIYTKTGDDGTTSIFTKKGGRSVRLSKHDPLIEAIGSVDGVNSYLGIINSKLKVQNSKQQLKTINLRNKLREIQRDLFTVGAILAGANIELKKLRTEELENEIDGMEKELPKLTGFILPGGTEISAHLMFARTLVRKAERGIVKLLQSKYKFKSKIGLKLKAKISILKYMNRLSDYMFVQARWVNHQSNNKELEWKMK